VAAQPVAITARAGHSSRPGPQIDTGSPTVVGYSVRLAGGERDRSRAVWYGGGRLARDLTLPALRRGWGQDQGEETRATAVAETTISRNWTWLEQQRLIRTERDHRVRKVTLLMEDGSGEAFERATGKNRGFFKLPYQYFTERIHLDLKLAGKAALLISLAQKPTFTLPTERAAEWYGISADTLQRGLDELRKHELIKVWSRTKKAPRSRYGYTNENHYALQGPFARAPIATEEVAVVLDDPTLTAGVVEI
jgi:hypothetical protein